MSRTKPERNRPAIPADECVLRARAAVLAQLAGRRSRPSPATFRAPDPVSSLEEWRLRRIVEGVTRELQRRKKTRRQFSCAFLALADRRAFPAG